MAKSSKPRRSRNESAQKGQSAVEGIKKFGTRIRVPKIQVEGTAKSEITGSVVPASSESDRLLRTVRHRLQIARRLTARENEKQLARQVEKQIERHSFVFCWSRNINNDDSNGDIDSKLHHLKQKIQLNFDQIRATKPERLKIQRFLKDLGNDAIRIINFFDLNWMSLNVEKALTELSLGIVSRQDDEVDEFPCTEEELELAVKLTRKQFLSDLESHTESFISLYPSDLDKGDHFASICQSSLHATTSHLLNYLQVTLETHLQQFGRMNNINKVKKFIEDHYFTNNNEHAIKLFLVEDIINETDTDLTTTETAETRPEIASSIDEAEAQEVLSAVEQLREDFATYRTQPTYGAVTDKPKWPGRLGPNKTAMRAPEWLQKYLLCVRSR